MTDALESDRAEALALTLRIQEQAKRALEPLRLSMRMWAPDHAAIMWEAVALEAEIRANEARGKR